MLSNTLNKIIKPNFTDFTEFPNVLAAALSYKWVFNY